MPLIYIFINGMKAPNFLTTKTNSTDYGIPIKQVWLILALSLAFIGLFLLKPLILVVLAVFTGFVSLYYYPQFGLYLLSFFGVFIGLYLDFGSFVEPSSVLSNINAPVVDFVGLALLGVLGVKIIFDHTFSNRKSLLNSLYPVLYYGLFLLSALLSIIFIFEYSFLTRSIHYTFRFLVLSYLAFVMVPLFFIRTKKQLIKVLQSFFFAGVLASIFGLSSLLIDISSWSRVKPYEIFGISPLRYNQNILAEILVAVVPVGGYLAYKNSQQRISHLCGVGLMVLAALLTLSRAAWICLTLELVVAGYIFPKQRAEVIEVIKEYKNIFYTSLLAIIPTVGYMAYYLTSHVVDSSNQARLMVLEITYYFFKENPLFGFAPGSFVEVLSRVEAYRIQFGSPLDAHGFIQKILLEQGLIGLATFGIFLLWVLYTVWSSARKSNQTILMSALFISVVAAVTFQLFNTSYYNAHMWLPLGFALSGVKISSRELLAF